MLGYIDQGKAQAAETIALAEKIGHPFTLAFAWNFVALAAGLRLDIGSLSAAAENSLAVARAHSFPTWTSFGLIAGGYGRGVGSDAAEGFGMMVEGLDIALPTGAQTPMPFIFGLLSELYALLGQEEEALHMVDVGLAMAQENREGLSIPDLHRRRGELLLAMGRPWSEADAALRQAAVEARSRSARLHELRALAARLRAARLHAPGEVAVALTELAACCGWFTEGWDAADLLAARRELGEGTS
jgi:hypothetical protein